jgi:hypothetical protein
VVTALDTLSFADPGLLVAAHNYTSPHCLTVPEVRILSQVLRLIMMGIVC